MSKLNQQVDKLVKEAAQMGPETKWRESEGVRMPLCPQRPRKEEDCTDVIELQKENRDIQELLRKWEHQGWSVFQYREDLTLAAKIGTSKELPVLVMPSCLRNELIELAHHQRHFGKEKTLQRLQTVAWWPGMAEQVVSFINQCLNCTSNDADNKVTKGPLKHQVIVGPLKRVQIDFIGPLPQSGRGKKYILVTVDSFTKWIEAYATVNNMAVTTARTLLNEAFARYGISDCIDSDQAPIL